MCDTLVALGNSTKDGSVLFAKNSDREPNEAHEIKFFPAADHSEGETLKCTYLSIPQVSHTNAVLLAKPFWIWGAEMGANEFGVVIGNEAVFGKAEYQKDNGLIGMDFIRLALERSKTAYEALQVMIDLLETYGQGGNCGFKHPLYYHNSFLITDHESAWVLETIDKIWVAENVQDVRTISNALTIEEKWDMASSNLVSYAKDKGWYSGNGPFNFKKVYSNALYPNLVKKAISSAERQQDSTAFLKNKKGKIILEDLLSLLKTHNQTDKGNIEWRPDYGILGCDICMHAGYGPARGSQSVGSMISQISEKNNLHWLTGTSAPCTGIFKPFWFDTTLPAVIGEPKGEYDPDSLFWQHELLHREILKGYSSRIKIVKEDLELLQTRILEEATKLSSASQEEREKLVRRSFEDSLELDKKLYKKLQKSSPGRSLRIPYSLSWNGYNQEAKIPIK